MDTLRKVTFEFDKEFERWINRTKKFNGFPLHTDSSGTHRIVRKTLMNMLSKRIQIAPPVKIGRRGKPNQYNQKKFKYEGIL